MIDIAARSDLPETDLAGLEAAVRATCLDRGVTSATVGLMVVTADDMAAINAEHRGKPEATDVLSFPVDGPEAMNGWPQDGPAPELGDVIICPAAALEPLTTLAVHGVLHLLGYDHEVDGGEMLALQDSIVERL